MAGALEAFASEIKHDDCVLLRKLGASSPNFVTIGVLSDAIATSVADRIKIAEALLRVAQDSERRAIATRDEWVARNAASRGYYCIHHTVRAALLFRIGSDVHSHRESLERYARLAKDGTAPALKAKLRTELNGTVEDINRLEQYLQKLRRWREIADYSVYNAADFDASPEDSFKNASEMVSSAGKILSASKGYLAGEGVKL